MAAWLECRHVTCLPPLDWLDWLDWVDWVDRVDILNTFDWV